MGGELAMASTCYQMTDREIGLAPHAVLHQKRLRRRVMKGQVLQGLSWLVVILAALHMQSGAVCASDKVRIIDPGEFHQEIRDARAMYDAKYFADCCFPCSGICLKEVGKTYCKRWGGKVIDFCTDCTRSDCPPDMAALEDVTKFECINPPEKTVVEEQLVDHPEMDGSLSAREFLLEAAIAYPADLPRRVWKDPKGVLRKGQRKLKKAERIRDVRAEQDALSELGTIYYLTGRFKEAEDSY